MDWRQNMGVKKEDEHFNSYPQYPHNPQYSGAEDNITDITDITDNSEKVKNIEAPRGSLTSEVKNALTLSKREGTANQDRKMTIEVCADCLAGRVKGTFQAGGVQWCRLNPVKGGPADFKPAPENCPAGNPTFKERQKEAGISGGSA